MLEHRPRGRRVPPAWAVMWALALLFLLGVLLLPEPPHRLAYVRITNQRGIPLWIVVYHPEPPLYERAPAAVICQPFNSAPEYGRLLALELVRDGFVVATFDWRGRGRAENRQLMGSGAREILRADAAAAVDYLRRLPGVDPRRVVIGGHSVGGTLAIETAAEDSGIAGVASIGMEADVAPEGPRNLLWAPGLYDEFRVLNRMRDVFQASAGTVAMEGTTVGDFTRGTARRLGVSPTADHFTELQDRLIHREVVRWFRQCVGLPASTRWFWMETRTLLLLLAGVTGLVASLTTLRRLAVGRRWALRVANAAALSGVVLISQIRGPKFLLASEAIFWLVIFTLLAGFLATREAAALAKGGRFAARLGLLVWSSLLLTFAVNNLANYLHQPRYLLWLPEFALRHALDGLYAYLVVGGRTFLFSTYTPDALTPRMWVYFVLATEVLVPGFFLGLVARLIRKRRPASQEHRPRPWISAAALVALLAFLAVVAALRIRQGFLTPESAFAALRFLARFAVLPMLFFSILWRWTRRQEAPKTA